MPAGFTLLVALIPGVLLLAYQSTAGVFGADERRLFTPLIAIVFALSAIHIAGLITGSSHLGAIIGLLLVGGAGYAGWIVRRRQKHPRVETTIENRPTPRALYAVALAAVGLLVPAIVLYNFHDEVPFTGHLSMTSTIANDVYPPRNLTYPHVMLRYHYAIDLMAALAVMILRLRPDHALDVVTMFLAGYTIVLSWPLLVRITKGTPPVLLTLVVLFAGGLAFLAPNPGDMCHSAVACEAMSFKWIGSNYINPPLSSTYFQHPFTLGFPLALGILVLFLDTLSSPELGRRRAVLLLSSLALLALTQFVFFLEFIATFAAALALTAIQKPTHRRTCLIGLALVTASVGLAVGYGGFFAPAPTGGSSSSLVVASGGVGGDLADSVTWHFATFGMTLPLGLLGLRRLQQGRFVFLCLVGGSLLIINVVAYEHSWDILKFATAAHLFLALASVEAIRSMLEQGSKKLRAVAWLSFAIAIAYGVAYSATFWTDIRVPHFPAVERGSPYPGLSAEDVRAVDWLRTHVKPGELTYRRRDAAAVYARFAGIPQVWGFDAGAEGFGFPKAWMERRRRFLNGVTCEVLVDEDVQWIVLDGRDPRDAWRVLEGMERDNVVTRAFTAGDVVVFSRDVASKTCP